MSNYVWSTRLTTIVCGLILVGMTGCAEELDAPDPEFSGEAGAADSEQRLVEPPFICNTQIEERRVEIRGEQFSPIVIDSLEEESDIQTPVLDLERSTEIEELRETGEATSISFGSGTANESRLRWLEQETLQVLFNESDNLKPGLYDMTLTNPDGDSATRQEAFGMLPSPVVESVDPNIACAGSGEQDITVSGGPFLESPDGEISPVDIGEQTFEGEDLEAGDCRDFQEGPFNGWSICSEVTATISVDAYEPGLKTVGISNLEPAACQSSPEEDDVQFRVLRRPVVDNVEPSPVCTQQNTYTATVLGQNFVFNTEDDTTPTVTVDGETVDVVGPQEPANADACEATDIDGIYSCEEIDIDLSPEGLLHEDGTITDSDVLVNNPPEREECISNQPGSIQNAPPPQVDAAEVMGTCGDASETMVIEGDFQFEMGEGTPSVEITSPSGTTATYDDVELAGMCTELSNTSEETRYCDVTNVTLTDHSDPSDGEYTIGYQNPEAVQCQREETLQVQRVIPEEPVISGFEEDAVCGLGGSLTVTGENFKDGATVTLGETEADSADVSDDGTRIDVAWEGEIEAGDDPELTVRNPDQCTASTSVADSLDIVDGPLAVFLDPPVHYNQIDLRGTLYASGGTDREISLVEIRDDNEETRDLDFDNPTLNDGEVSPLLPAEDPKNAGMPLPPGEYDVRLTEEVSGDECGAWVEDLVSVTADENLAVEEIEPKFGGTNTSTSVRITAADSVSGNETQFESTPRVYVSPTSNTSGTEARELSGVTFNSPTEVTGIVPSGLATGEYNVVVVNPDETVGVLSPPDGFEITADPPPTISNVSPGTWDTNDIFEATVSGQNFRVSSGQTNPDPVAVTCEGPDPNSVSVQSATGNEITLDVDTNGMDDSDACVMEITNPDGTKATYSPVATVNPASNFVDFEDGTSSWSTARRWPAMSSGIPSAQQRFLYALGGDDGSTGGVHASGEFAQIDQFGNLQSWRDLPNDLPGNGRTLARTHRVGDFVYLVGGNDGSSATGDVHRANVLDPQHSPDIDGLDFEFDEASGDGLDPGVYYYRVSAVHTSGSDHNPGGETLTSDVQPVYVPDLSGRFSVQVTLTWSSSLSDVDEFRLYRSPTFGATVGEEELLATFGANTNTHTDDGTGTFTSETPLPVGALGQWDQVGSLNTARQKHGVTGLINPTDETEAYIYAVGGEDDSGNVFDSVERITITNADQPRSQSVSGIATSAETMSEARTELEVAVAAPSNANNLPSGDAYLYAMGGGTDGMGGNTDSSDVVDIWPIQTQSSPGALDTIESGDSMLKKRAGHVGTVANNFMLLFGGQNAAPDDSGDNSNELADPDSTMWTFPGEITDWNSLGDVNMKTRYQFGRSSLVGFFYIGGGVGDGGAVRNSVEYSVVGTTGQ